MAARRRSHRSVRLIERNRALELRGTRASHPGPRATKRRSRRAVCSTQRAGIASPHAEDDGLSGVTRDGETDAFICGPAAFVGGKPVTRARNPWAIPEPST
jgi:hypothetical protein